MVAPVDEVDSLFAALVLLVLAVQHLVHGGKLAVQSVLPQLLVLHGQDQHAGKIHQRADGKDAHVDIAARQKAQIAHRKGSQRQHDRRQGSAAADLQVPGGLGADVQPIAHPPEQRPVHQRQQQQRQRSPRAAGGPEGAVQLPLHAGGKLCQNKRPGAMIPGFQQGNAPHAPQI